MLFVLMYCFEIHRDGNKNEKTTGSRQKHRGIRIRGREITDNNKPEDEILMYQLSYYHRYSGKEKFNKEEYEKEKGSNLKKKSERKNEGQKGHLTANENLQFK